MKIKPENNDSKSHDKKETSREYIQLLSRSIFGTVSGIQWKSSDKETGIQSGTGTFSFARRGRRVTSDVAMKLVASGQKRNLHISGIPFLFSPLSMPQLSIPVVQFEPQTRTVFVGSNPTGEIRLAGSDSGNDLRKHNSVLSASPLQADGGEDLEDLALSPEDVVKSTTDEALPRVSDFYCNPDGSLEIIVDLDEDNDEQVFVVVSVQYKLNKDVITKEYGWIVDEPVDDELGYQVSGSTKITIPEETNDGTVTVELRPMQPDELYLLDKSMAGEAPNSVKTIAQHSVAQSLDCRRLNEGVVVQDVPSEILDEQVHTIQGVDLYEEVNPDSERPFPQAQNGEETGKPTKKEIERQNEINQILSMVRDDPKKVLADHQIHQVIFNYFQNRNSDIPNVEEKIQEKTIEIWEGKFQLPTKRDGENLAGYLNTTIRHGVIDQIRSSERQGKLGEKRLNHGKDPLLNFDQHQQYQITEIADKLDGLRPYLSEDDKNYLIHSGVPVAESNARDATVEHVLKKPSRRILAENMGFTPDELRVFESKLLRKLRIIESTVQLREEGLLEESDERFILDQLRFGNSKIKAKKELLRLLETTIAIKSICAQGVISDEEADVAFFLWVKQQSDYSPVREYEESDLKKLGIRVHAQIVVEGRPARRSAEENLTREHLREMIRAQDPMAHELYPIIMQTLEKLNGPRQVQLPQFERPHTRLKNGEEINTVVDLNENGRLGKFWKKVASMVPEAFRVEIFDWTPV